MISESKKVLNKNDIRQLKLIKPAPTLQGIPKVHKPDSKIWLLVNFISAAAFMLAKNLNKIIKPEVVHNNHNFSK